MSKETFDIVAFVVNVFADGGLSAKTVKIIHLWCYMRYRVERSHNERGLRSAICVKMGQVCNVSKTTYAQ